ncbi:MAG: hypothetical protein U5L45_19120 [Saprospiraceae bacterium]|nr:hypothetical protein [Saprospiraceae bacterium]
MKKNNKTMTAAQVLRDPSLAHFHDMIRDFQNSPSKDIFPQKYEAGVIDAAMDHLFEIFEKQPKMSFKALLRRIIAQLPDDITPTLLFKVLHQAHEEWEGHKAAVQKESVPLATTQNENSISANGQKENFVTKTVKKENSFLEMV